MQNYHKIIPDEWINNPSILFVAVFAESSSKNFYMVLDLAFKCSYFNEVLINKNRLFIVGFSHEVKDQMLLYSIADMTKRWKGFHIFYKGIKLLDRQYIVHTMDCLEKSHRLEDKKQWCRQEITLLPRDSTGMIRIPVMKVEIKLPLSEAAPEPRLLRVGEFIYIDLPCRRLYLSESEIKAKNMTDLRQTVMIKAIENNCDWCPNFKLDDIKMRKEPYGYED